MYTISFTGDRFWGQRGTGPEWTDDWEAAHGPDDELVQLSTPVSCTASEHATWAITCGGQLYGMGALWHATLPGAPPAPALSLPVPVVQLAAGRHHVIILCQDASVWTWGYGAHGRLGHGDELARTEPTPVASLHTSAGRNCLLAKGTQIIAVGAGGGHCLALAGRPGSTSSCSADVLEASDAPAQSCTAGACVAAASGTWPAQSWATKLFTWGMNRYAQCGAPACRARLKPVAMQLPDAGRLRYCGVTGGRHHSLLLDTRGGVRTWGATTGGRLGHMPSPRKLICSAPEPVVFPERGVAIQQVACGDFHTLAMDSKGRVWAWGLNETGQAAGGARVRWVLAPKLVTLGDTASQAIKAELAACAASSGWQCLQVSAGSRTSAVLASLPDQRRAVWTWGDGENGLGQHHTESVTTPWHAEAELATLAASDKVRAFHDAHPHLTLPEACRAPTTRLVHALPTPVPQYWLAAASGPSVPVSIAVGSTHMAVQNYEVV